MVSTSGSVPGKVGARLALTDFEMMGTVGGAGLEMKVISHLKKLLQGNKNRDLPQLKDIDPC